MSRDQYNIHDIIPNMKKNWTVLIQVLAYGHIQLSRENKNFRRLMFADTQVYNKSLHILQHLHKSNHVSKQGTRVAALIWNNDLGFYENTFEPYKRYQISNANLIYNEPRFQLDSYGNSWTPSKLALIEPFQDETPPTLTCKFTFTPFSDLYKYADEEKDLSMQKLLVLYLSLIFNLFFTNFDVQIADV